MPCRNVGMIVTCLRALVIVGERINIDEELGGEIVKDRIGDVDVGLQTEAGMPHKRDRLCCKHGGLPSGVTLLGDQAALAKC